MKYKIYTLGCKVNQYDSSMLSRKLSLNGFKEYSGEVDLAVINTCAVTKTAIDKCKKTVIKARKENPKAKIIIMGCGPKIYNKDFNDLDHDIIWEVGRFGELLEDIKKIFNIKENNKGDDNKKTDYFDGRSRYMIKIQDGCEQFCSYCVVPYTRGKLKSRKPLEVVEEIEKVCKMGYREIILSGIHLGLYGAESGGMKLSGLIKLLLQRGRGGRVRLSSIEATEVNSDIINLLAQNRKSGYCYLCKHLHLPLQSGSGKILKAMNRPYTKEEFVNKVKEIRKAVGDIALTTDVIVGFPGETDEDFEETRVLLEELNFSKIHVFPFSPHELTPASKMKDQVSDEIKVKRARILRDLSDKQRKDFKDSFRGQILDLVVEKSTGDRFVGKGEYYFDVEFRKDQVVGGDLEEKKIVKVKV